MTKTETTTADAPEGEELSAGSSLDNQDVIQMYEELFKDRYTEEDKDFTATNDTPLMDPPCVENWYSKPKRSWDWSNQRNQQRYGDNQRGHRGGGYHGRGGGYRGGNRGNWQGGYQRDYGNQGHYQGGNQRGGRGRDYGGRGGGHRGGYYGGRGGGGGGGGGGGDKRGSGRPFYAGMKREEGGSYGQQRQQNRHHPYGQQQQRQYQS